MAELLHLDVKELMFLSFMLFLGKDIQDCYNSRECLYLRIT